MFTYNNYIILLSIKSTYMFLGRDEYLRLYYLRKISKHCPGRLFDLSNHKIQLLVFVLLSVCNVLL